MEKAFPERGVSPQVGKWHTVPKGLGGAPKGRRGEPLHRLRRFPSPFKGGKRLSTLKGIAPAKNFPKPKRPCSPRTEAFFMITV